MTIDLTHRRTELLASHNNNNNHNKKKNNLHLLYSYT